MEIQFDDGSVREVSREEAVRIRKDLSRQLGDPNPEEDFDVDPSLINIVLRSKYPKNDHLLASRTGRLWHILCRMRGSTQIRKVPASYVLEMKSRVLEGGMAYVGPVAKEEYELLCDAITQQLKLTTG